MISHPREATIWSAFGSPPSRYFWDFCQLCGVLAHKEALPIFAATRRKLFTETIVHAVLAYAAALLATADLQVLRQFLSPFTAALGASWSMEYVKHVRVNSCHRHEVDS